jgi:hypothetical protein
VDLVGRFTLLSDDQKKLLGCTARTSAQALDYIGSMSREPTNYQTIAVDGNFLTRSGGVLRSAFCQSSTAPLTALIELYEKWAKAGAFTDLDLRSRALAYHEELVANPVRNGSVGGKAEIVSDTLRYRETIADFMVAWSIAKLAVPVTDDTSGAIESWLGSLVEQQAYSYAESPLDVSVL